jgi:hypothetical protein
MDIAQLIGLAGVPVLAALIQAIKTALPSVDARYWPVASIVIGIGYNLALGALMGEALGIAAVVGLVAGLAASGLYSQARTAIQG